MSNTEPPGESVLTQGRQKDRPVPYPRLDRHTSIRICTPILRDSDSNTSAYSRSSIQARTPQEREAPTEYSGAIAPPRVPVNLATIEVGVLHYYMQTESTISLDGLKNASRNLPPLKLDGRGSCRSLCHARYIYQPRHGLSADTHTEPKRKTSPWPPLVIRRSAGAVQKDR